MTEQNLSRRNFLELTAAFIGGGASVAACGRLENKPYILPEKLPDAVNSIHYGVVFVSDAVVPPVGVTLSGVKIGPRHILTAGHAFRNQNGSIFPQATCIDNAVIQGYSSNGHLIESKAKKIASSYNIKDSVADVALIETVNPINELPSFSLSDTPIISGEGLYFINYEPTSYGAPRYPTQYERLLRYPAMFGGIALPTTSTSIPHDTLVQLGLKSYGRVPDSRIRQGASGGAVADRNGFLVGISDDESNNGDYAYVQPVTQNLLRALYTKLQTNPDACVQ